MPNTGDVVSCGLCGGKGLRRILDLGMQPLAEVMATDAPSYPLRLVQCEGCDLVQLDHVAPPAEVFPPEHPYASGNAKALHEHFKGLADKLSQHLATGDLVVDIGCNDGTLLSKFPASVRRLGVDPTNQVWKATGTHSVQGFFTAEMAAELVAQHGQAVVVIATNVLAHVPDPHDFLQGVKLLLADDGVFVTENHSLESVLNGQWDTVYHEHVRYYQPPVLSRLLVENGLATQRVERIATHGGSFRLYAAPDTRPTHARRDPKGSHKQHPSLQPDADKAAKALRAMLEKIVKREGRIYGVGATTRASALIHFADIADHLCCVVEVAGSEKIGKHMPGTTLQVRDEQELIDKQPEFALLFSWHIAGHIIPSLRAKGYHGKFIVPLPQPHVVDE